MRASYHGNWRLTFAFEGEDAILLPAHPGEVLKEIMEGRTVAEVAKHIGVTRAALSRVLNGRAAVSAEMAIRLGGAFRIDPGIWLRMQTARDLWVANQKKLKVKPLPRLTA